MKMKPGCGDMGGDEGAGGRELPAEMSPLPLFPGGFWPGAESPPAACWCPSHGRLPRAGASFSGRWKRLLANHRRKPQRCSGRRWAVGSCLPAAQGQSGAAPPPGVGSPQRAASPRLLLSLLAVLAWCRAHACLDLFLRGAGCLLGDSLAAMPCWQWGAGGLCPHHPSLGFPLSGYPRSCSDISPSQQISSFPTCPCSESGWCCERGGWSGGCRGFGQDGC